METWRDKTVFITGAGGFVGKHLASALKKRGAKVVGITRSRKAAYENICDVRDLHALGCLFEKYRFDICYHLAGLTQVETGQESPQPTFDTNITGAINILECSRVYGIKNVIISSTSHVYGCTRVPYRESYTPKPTRPYETSKACVDLVAMSYARTYGLPVRIARFVNIYGPGDVNYSRLIPKTMRSLVKGQQPDMWGGGAKRDFLYIDDAIEAYVKLGALSTHDSAREDIYNFGANNIISVEDLIRAIIRISGKDIAIHKISDKREQEISTQYVSWAKARRVLGWEPNTTLLNGLAKTYTWYEKRHA